MKKNKNKHINTYLALWLDGKLSDQELKTYIPEKEVAEYKELKKQLLLYEQLEAPLDTSFVAIKKKINQKVKVRKLYRQAVIATGSIAAIFALVFFTLSFSSENFTTNIAESKTILLPDNSQITLNANSQLSYNAKKWEKGDREIQLDGEAFFKVEHGSTFTVKTPYGEVEVLGTEFNVIASKNYFQVICYSGKVKVSTPTENTILIPKKAIQKINKNSFEKWTTNFSQPTWLDGESTFRSVPLTQVIFALENQFGVTITKNSAINTSQRFTGSFNHTNLQLALNTVFKAMNIQFEQINNNQIELSL